MDRGKSMQDVLSRLVSNPYDLSLVKELEQASRDDVGALVDDLEREGRQQGEGDAAARCLLEAGRLAALHLEEIERGAALIEDALVAGEETLVSVEGHLFRLALAGDGDELLGYFTEALGHLDDGAYQGRLYLRMGEILWGVLGDAAEASTAFQYAAELAPGDRAAVWAQQDLARDQQDWVALAELLYAEVEMVDGAIEQARASARLGQVYLERLNEPENALQCFGFAYELEPTNELARRGLEALGQDLEELSVVAVEEDDGERGEGEPAEAGQASDEADVAEVELKGGEPIEDEHEDELSEVDTVALDSEVLEMVEEVEVEEPEASGPPELPSEAMATGVEREEEFAGEGEIEDRAAGVEGEGGEADEEAPRGEGASAGDEGSGADAGANGPEAASGGEVEGGVDDESGAAEEPPQTSGGWLEQVEELRAEAIGALESGDEDGGLAGLVRVLRVQARHEADVEDVVAVWEGALEAGLGVELYEQAGHLWESEELWSSVLELAGAAEQDTREFEALLAFRALGDLDAAAQLAAPEAEESRVRAMLDDVEAAQANWRKYQRGLEKRWADLADEAKARAVYLTMADLAAALGDENKEVDALRRLDRQVEDALVADRLKVLYGRAGKWPMYVDLLKKEAEGLEEGRSWERVDVLEEAIRVYRDEMNHDMMVVNTYKDILEIDPENMGAIDALIGMYERMNRASELINMLRVKADYVATDDERVELYCDIAELFVEKFRNQAEAIKTYEQVLELRPHHRAAIDFLKEMYEKRRDWQKLIDVHKRDIETLEGDDERVAALKEVAQLATDRLRKPDIATQLWGEVRDRAPEDEEALAALEKLFEKSRDYEALAEVLEARVKLSGVVAEQMKIYQKLGMLFADRLDAPGRAIEAWRGALEVSPGDLKARKALEKLYIELELWDDLEGLYAADSAWHDLVRLLETRAGAAEQGIKIELLLRAARIWQEELGEGGRAQRDLERVIAEDARNERAARQLAPIYRAAGGWEALEEALKIILEHQEGVEARREFLVKLAELREGELGDARGAFEWYARAYREAPEQALLGEKMREAAVVAQAWAPLAEVYRGVLEEELDAEVELGVRLRLGAILADPLETLDDALGQYQAVLQSAPGHLEALECMEEIYRRAARWDELQEVYQRRLDLAEEVVEKVSILSEMAKIAEEQAGDAGQATAYLERARELDERDARVLGELHRLYRGAEAWEELAEAIRAEIGLIEAAVEQAQEGRSVAQAVEVGELVPGAGVEAGAPEVSSEAAWVYREDEIEALVALRLELGGVSGEHLGEDEAAVEAFGAILGWRPLHEEALAGLEGYLEGAQRGEVARVLGPIYEARGDWAELVEVLEHQLETTEDPEEQRRLLERLGEVELDERGESEAAFAVYKRLMAHEPASGVGRQQARRVAHESGLWSELIEHYEEVLEGVESETLRVDYLFELAEMYGERLEDSEQAQALYNEILKLESESDRAMDALEGLYAQTEQWSALLEVYEKRIAAAEEVDVAREYEFRKAVLHEQMLDDADKAIEIFRGVLEEEPQSLRAVEGLSRLYRAGEQWEALVDNLHVALELADEAAQNAVRNELGGVYRGHLGEFDRAVDYYEEVLELDPSDRVAGEALVELMTDAEAPRRRVSEILEPLCVDGGDWRGLIDVLEVQVDTAQGDGEAVGLLHRVAELWEQQGDEAREAFETQARALARDPSREETLGALYRLAEAMEDWGALESVLAEQAFGESNTAVMRDLYWRSAQINIDHLEDLEAAAEQLEAVREALPDDLETVEALEALYQQVQRWEPLVDVLRAKAGLVEEDEQRKALLYQAGGLFEDILDRAEDAVEVYRSVLEVDDSDAHAIDRLEVIYANLARWEDLLEIYRRKLDLAEEDDGRVDLLYAMGAIWREHLEEPFEAINVYNELLAIDATELPCLEELDGLYEETAQWPELLEVLSRQMELVEFPEDRLKLRHRTGQIWEEELGDGVEAVAVYAEVLAEEPTYEATRAALEGMVAQGMCEVQAAEVLQPVYESHGEWQKLVPIYKQLVEASPDPQRQLELHSEIARIWEEELENRDEAFSAWVEAMKVAPTDEGVLADLERLSAQLDQWNYLIAEMDRVHEDSADYAAAVVNHLRVARILEQELGLVDEAVERHQRVLELEPDNEEAIASLDRLYQQAGRWEDLAEVLAMQVANSVEPIQTRELRLRLGTLLRDALDEAERAIDVYQTVLMEDPDNGPATQALEQMFMAGQVVERIGEILEPHYLARGEHEKLVELYLQRLEVLAEPQERHALLMQIGRILLDELGDEARALDAYGMALSERPGDEELVARVDALAEETGGWDSAAAYYVEALEREHIDEVDALELWVNLARILGEQLGAQEDAEAAYLQALELDEQDARALEALDELYTGQGRYEALADILSRRIEGIFDDDALVEIHYRLAEVYQLRLERLDEAIETYRRLLELSPEHDEALAMLEQMHTQRQEWEELFDVLDRRATQTMDPDEQRGFWARMANLAESMLERPLDAIDLWGRVLEVDPQDADALDRLSELYLDEQRWDDLVGILERRVELALEPGEKLALYDALGHVWSDRIGDELRALEAWREVLELDPMHLEALESVRDLYTRQADYEQLAEVLPRLIDHDAVEEERKQGLWTELAEINGDMLMRPIEAIGAWRQVLAMDMGNGLALENLERLYLQESMWEEAAGVLELKIDTMEDEGARIDELLRVADLYENKLMEPGQAARQYEMVLEVEPTHGPAGHALEAIYLGIGDEESLTKLVGLYLDRAEIIEDAFDRSETLRAAAQVFEERLEQPESALLVLLSAFGLETVEDVELRQKLETLARQTGLWDELVDRFAAVVHELGDSFASAELHRQVGGWYAGELDEPDEAVMHLQRARAIDPENEEILASLESLYHRLAAWPELANVVAQRIDITTDPHDQIDLWRKLGELYELQIGAIDEAIEAYQQIMLLDDTDLLAVESLERIFEANERWPELIDALGRKSESTFDPEEIVAVKMRIAGIYERELEDAARAVQAYQEVLAVEQYHRPSLEALERLYLGAEQWAELLEVYEQELNTMHEPQEQVAIYGRMAAVHEDHLGDLERAVDAYNNVLNVMPEHEGALSHLARLYEAQERWFDLSDTLSRHATLVDDVDVRIGLLNDLGRVQRDQLDDLHSAVESLEESLRVKPDQLQVARELASLYEQSERFERAVDTYREIARMAADDAERAETFHRIGELCEQDLLDDERAERAFLDSLSIDPGRDYTIKRLRELYARGMNWQGLIDVLKGAEAAAQDLEPKARYLAEIGAVFDEHLDDRVSALNYYERALETDPQVIEAAEPLIDAYMRENRWERAVPLLEMVLEEYEERDVDAQTLHRRRLQSARVYDELAQHELALEHYRAAYESDPKDFETLRGFGNLLYAEQEYERASTIYGTLEVEHLDKLDEEQLVLLYFRSGEMRRQFGEVQAAVASFERALGVDGYHGPSLERLVELFEASGEWNEVVEYRRRRLETEAQAERRFTLLCELADVFVNKLGDRDQAVQAYVEALEVDPRSVVVLRKLLDLYTKTQRWRDAVEILHRLIEQSDQASRIARYKYTVGVIFRDEIGSPLEAVRYFDEALDYDVKMLKAFEAIDRIMTQAKEWKELERAYRRMLRRVSEAPAGEMDNIKVLLWSNLGEIYRSRLGHVKSAIGAYEAAVGLKPDARKFRLILAELYGKMQGDSSGAIEQHKELIKLDPFRIESYRALFNAYIKQREYDKAWCMSAALSFLQNATEAEQGYYEKYAGQNLRAAQGQFKPETYQRIYHQDEELLISYIMSILGAGLRGFYYTPVKNQWGVHKKKDLLDVEQQQPFCNVYRYVTRTMAMVPAPNVYLKRDAAMGIRNANSEVPAVIIGADMMQGKTDRELAFQIGKQMAWMRPEHYLGSVGYPTEFLKILFMATMHITDTSLGIGPTLGEQGARYIGELQGMPAQHLMQLQKLMRQYLSTGRNPNLSAWLTAVEHTAIRAGLVVCGNLHEAASAVKNDRSPLGKATVKDKIRELVLFSISDEYFEVRRNLGLAIG